MTRLYVPRNSAARSVGADEVAAALAAAGHEVIRNGSRGLLFLEPWSSRNRGRPHRLWPGDG